MLVLGCFAFVSLGIWMLASARRRARRLGWTRAGGECSACRGVVARESGACVLCGLVPRAVAPAAGASRGADAGRRVIRRMSPVPASSLAGGRTWVRP